MVSNRYKNEKDKNYNEIDDHKVIEQFLPIQIIIKDSTFINLV